MDSVRATLSRHLQQRIEASHDGELEVLCSVLADHFAGNATCSQILEQLSHPNKTTCAKDAATALHCKNEGNAAFGISSFQQALESYTKAIRNAPLGGDADEATLATLFVNRAAALHALGLLDAADRDCTRGIKLYPAYSKAWYRRGRIGADLRDYGSATEDLEQALALEQSARGRSQVSRELEKVRKSALDVSGSGKSGQSVSRVWNAGESGSTDRVRPYWTAEKQWGLEATENLDVGSLVLEEDAVAAVLLKRHRNSHCHVCFNPLPPDPVACAACAIALYCHEDCRSAACEARDENVVAQGRNPGEHVYECGGASWSAVLPTDAVLATRLLVRNHGNPLLDKQLRELCHHYNELSGVEKVDLHVLSVVIANCISSLLEQAVGDLAAKLVHLIAIVRANAMGICLVHLDSIGASWNIQSGVQKSSLTQVEQVSVAQGIYVLGSKLNHSCSTNVHASFQNRRLRVQAIAPIQAGAPLELCYGPQVGEMSREERQKWLKERYFFTCTCLSCTTVVLPDLLLTAFRCSKVGCDGVVPGLALQKQSVEGVSQVLSMQGESLKGGQCMLCGMAVNLQCCSSAAKTVKRKLESLQSDIQSLRSSKRDSLLPRALDLLKESQTIFHPLSKELAKVEDVVAQAYCFIGLPSEALPHCRLAIEILENIYNKDHIVVANERLKLASIALAAGSNDEVQSNLAFVDRVMRAHYGTDHQELLHLKSLHPCS